MIERIKKLIKYKKLNSSQFAEAIGVQRSSISHILSGRNNPSLDFVLKIIETFPEIETEWLLFGNGEMLKKYDLFTNSKSTLFSKENKENSDKKTPEFNENSQNIEENPKEAQKQKESVPDFIDIISKNLFSGNAPGSGEQENQNKAENELSEHKKEDVLSNTSSISTNNPIERVIIFYRNGKFKEYTPF